MLTDPDMLFQRDCPDDWLLHYWNLLDRHPVSKVGAALKIDDIPDYFPLKDEVIADELQHWTDEKRVPGETEVYKTGIDTTLALYREGAEEVPTAS